eukprot:1140320-Pelagomonas_calceolata.AAC.6
MRSLPAGVGEGGPKSARMESACVKALLHAYYAAYWLCSTHTMPKGTHQKKIELTLPVSLVL